MYRLHGFSQSGNTYKVALALQALGQPWEAVHLPFADFVGGLTRSDDWRQEVNPMGEVPVLEEGARRLTQSAAIMLHLAERHGAYGGADADGRQEVLRWLFFDNHKFTSYFATWRFMKSFAPSEPDPVLARWMRGRVDSAFAIVERHLSTRDHLVGEAPTIADMSLCGYLYFPAAESGYDLATSHPNMARWLQRLQALPGWKGPYELLPGDAVAPRW